MSSKIETINEIKKFLDGNENGLKHIVNVEIDPNTNVATCIIHDNGKVLMEGHTYTPFMYMKNLEKQGVELFGGDKEMLRRKLLQHGITKEKMETGKQPRLENGYCYKLTSNKSYRAISNFLREGGLDPYEKKKDSRGKEMLDPKGKPIFKNRHYFYSPKPIEQFFISTGNRLYKGFEEYKNIHRLTFDIETSGLRYEICRIFAIGVKDNKGFETVLEVDKEEDDASEIKLIQDLFNTIDYVKPAIIQGYNSEHFDFDFILGRAAILGMDISKLNTTISKTHVIKRIPDQSVKIGGTAEKYTATQMWGYSINDIVFAAKKTVALNSDLKNAKLKYICKEEGIAKPNRTYIDGEDGKIFKFWLENKIFIVNTENNEYLGIPDTYQDPSKLLYKLQQAHKQEKISDAQYKKGKLDLLKTEPDLIKWFKENGSKYGKYKLTTGKTLLRQYLIDDLWETEQVDELYNQSAFLLAKIVPTTFQRISTMGTAAVWNLLLTAWSYDNNLAIPHPDVVEHFSGGLARCYKKGYYKRIVKIDFASLYPMEQLTWGIFPMFDISGVIEKMLLYMTTTRNIYKKIASSDPLNEEEIELMKEIDHETYIKYIKNDFTTQERAAFKVKQLPIKILNNSLFGALGSGFAFNWSDNICAARITCTGRIDLRYVIDWFTVYKCVPLLAVTDGVNFGIPDTTTIRVTDGEVLIDQPEGTIEEMWKFGGLEGIAALIEKFNVEEMKPPYMKVDNDGEFLSCLNLSRINYGLLTHVKDKKTGELVMVESEDGLIPKTKVKLTGNTIKSKTMPEYIEDFIDVGLKLILEGKGYEFVEFYYDYCEKLFYKRIPLKKIASKSRFKFSMNDYENRGTDKNGRAKAKQAHMELTKMDRDETTLRIFDEMFDELVKDGKKDKSEYSPDEMSEIIRYYMPPEPELDSMVYYVNIGLRKSHGDSKWINNPSTGKQMYCSRLISSKDMELNPELLGEYNVDKYLDAFNKRVEVLLECFDPNIREQILTKIKINKEKDPVTGKKIERKELLKSEFTRSELEVVSVDSDDIDESMYLEEKECEFWNRSGYDPRLIWNDFKTHETDDNLKVHYGIYEHALNHMGDRMEKLGLPRPKSVNEKRLKGDYILIKDHEKESLGNKKDGTYRTYIHHTYSLGYFNGKFVQIEREKLDIPKSPIELEFQRKREENEARLEMLRIEGEKKIDEIMKENELISDVDNTITTWFNEFKIKFNIPLDIEMNEFFEEVPDAKNAFDDYCNDKRGDSDEEYFDYDLD